jgi:ferredoxin-fold anticodon binding domain-containing protein
MEEEIKKEKLLKKQIFLQETLHRLRFNEPVLDLKDIACVISEEMGEELLPELIKQIKNENKKA